MPWARVFFALAASRTGTGAHHCIDAVPNSAVAALSSGNAVINWTDALDSSTDAAFKCIGAVPNWTIDAFCSNAGVRNCIDAAKSINGSVKGWIGGAGNARDAASGRESLGQQGVEAGLGLGGGGGLLGLEGADGFDALGKLALEVDGGQGNRDCLYVLLIDA